MVSEQDAFNRAVARMRGGTSRVDARLELLASGFSPDEAARITSEAANLVHAERQQRRRRDARLEMLAGLAFMLLSLGSCVYTFVATSGRWLLAPAGLFGFGLILLMDGSLRR